MTKEVPVVNEENASTVTEVNESVTKEVTKEVPSTGSERNCRDKFGRRRGFQK